MLIPICFLFNSLCCHVKFLMFWVWKCAPMHFGWIGSTIEPCNQEHLRSIEPLNSLRTCSTSWTVEWQHRVAITHLQVLVWLECWEWSSNEGTRPLLASRDINRELNQKWISQDSNWYLYMGCCHHRLSISLVSPIPCTKTCSSDCYCKQQKKKKLKWVC